MRYAVHCGTAKPAWPLCLDHQHVEDAAAVVCVALAAFQTHVQAFETGMIVVAIRHTAEQFDLKLVAAAGRRPECMCVHVSPGNWCSGSGSASPRASDLPQSACGILRGPGCPVGSATFWR